MSHVQFSSRRKPSKNFATKRLPRLPQPRVSLSRRSLSSSFIHAAMTSTRATIRTSARLPAGGAPGSSSSCSTISVIGGLKVQPACVPDRVMSKARTRARVLRPSARWAASRRAAPRLARCLPARDGESWFDGSLVSGGGSSVPDAPRDAAAAGSVASAYSSSFSLRPGRPPTAPLSLASTEEAEEAEYAAMMLKSASMPYLYRPPSALPRAPPVRYVREAEEHLYEIGMVGNLPNYERDSAGSNYDVAGSNFFDLNAVLGPKPGKVREGPARSASQRTSRRPGDRARARMTWCDRMRSFVRFGFGV